MNFTFGISHSQRKPFGFPLNMPLNMQTRQFSSFGLPTKKIDDLISKTGQFNVYNSPIVSNKCFSNPNFVNKNHPHILAPSVAGIVKFDTPSQNFCSTHIREENVPKNETKMHIVEEKLPEKPSQKEETNKMQVEPKPQRKFVDNCLTSPKMSRKNKRKKQHKNKQNHNHKGNKSHKNKNKKCSNKKSKPWHKTNLDHEIMELSESTLDSDSSTMLEDSVQPYCITISSKLTPTQTPYIKISPSSKSKMAAVPTCVNLTSKTSPIDINTDPIFQNIDKSDSSMSISPCHHELLKSLSSICVNKFSPCSPCSPKRIGRLPPSECESEDSFIVFENCGDSSDDLETDDSDFDEEECTDSDETDCDVEFSDKCDSRISVRKQVSFKDDSELCKVHPMIQWGYAYHSARCGPWEQLARDRARFEARIRKTEETLSKVLSPKHRENIYKERFEETITRP